MATALAIIVGVLAGLRYLRRGLFPAASALVSIMLPILAALAFAAPAVHTIAHRSPYAYSATMAGVALLGFVIVRGALLFLETDVDLPPLIDRAGGAVVGLVTGYVVVSFLCLCLLCMPIPQRLSNVEPSAHQTAEVVLQPCRQIARLLPGERKLDVDALLAAAGPQYSVYRVPPPPPAPREATLESGSRDGDATATIPDDADRS